MCNFSGDVVWQRHMSQLKIVQMGNFEVAPLKALPFGNYKDTNAEIQPMIIFEVQGTR